MNTRTALVLLTALLASPAISAPQAAATVIKVNVNCDAAAGNAHCDWSTSDETELKKAFGKKAKDLDVLQGTSFTNGAKAAAMLMTPAFAQTAKKSKCLYSGEATLLVSSGKLTHDDEGLPWGEVVLESVVAAPDLKLTAPASEQGMYGYKHCKP